MGQQFENIHRRPAQDQYLQTRGITRQRRKQSHFKLQAFISVNHIPCKALPLVCSWNYSKYQSGSFWPYKEKKGGIRVALAKVGQTQTFLAYYQHVAFCAEPHPAHPPPHPLSHLAQFSMCFSFCLGVSKEAGAIKEGCGEEADEA